MPPRLKTGRDEAEHLAERADRRDRAHHHRRDGWITPFSNPPSDITAISTAEGMFTHAIRIAMVDVRAKTTAATARDAACGRR